MILNDHFQIFEKSSLVSANVLGGPVSKFYVESEFEAKHDIGLARWAVLPVSVFIDRDSPNSKETKPQDR